MKSPLRFKAAIPLAVVVLFTLGASAAHAIMYNPGETLTPGCAPNAPGGCGVTAASAQTPWAGNISAAGHTLYGNSTASGNLTLDSTSNGTKGYVLLNPVSGNVGIGNPTPDKPLSITSATEGALIRLRGQDTTSPLDFTYNSGGTFEGVVDNIYTWDFNPGGAALDQPIYSENFESRFNTPGADPNGMLERHANYVSIDRSVSYRPWASAIDLNTNKFTLEYDRVAAFDIWDTPHTNLFRYTADNGTLTLPTIAASSYTIGSWNANAISAAKGGTSLDTSASSGIPSINAGSWQINTPGIGYIPVIGSNSTLINSPISASGNDIAIGTTVAGGVRINVAQSSGGGIPDMIRLNGAVDDALGTGHAITWYSGLGSGVYQSGKIYSVFDAADYGAGRLTFVTLNSSGTELDTLSLKNGKVGIGTTSPDELLSLGLAGTKRGVLSLAGNDSGKIIIQPAAAAGTWTMTLPTTAGTSGQVLQTDGTGITTWASAAGGAQTPWTANVNAAGYTLQGNITENGNLTLDSTSSGTKGYVLINPSGGNVGIGTTTPWAALTVLGSSTVPSLTHGTGAIATFGYSVGNELSIFGNGGLAPYTISLQTRHTVSDGVDYPLALNPLGGNIGIGTTGPLSKLDVNGGLAVGSYAGANAAPSNGLIVSGNVGIGTTGSSAPLEVGGLAAAPGATGGASNGIITAYATNTTVTLAMGTLAASPYSAWLQTYDPGGGHYPIALNPLGGNVGIGTDSPNTTLQVNGGITRKVTAVNAATYDLLITDDILDVTYTATGAVTNLKLPTAQMVAGRMIVIEDGGLNAGANNITVTTEGAEQINGADTLVLSHNGESYTLVVNAAGTGWRIIGHYAP